MMTMLVLDQGMQQKLSNSWKLGCKSEYEDEMAEDGDGPGVTSPTSSPSSITTNGGVNNSNSTNGNGGTGNSGPGSIVNSLLLKKTGNYFGGDTSPGSGLEQKIKELKKEKETTDCNVEKKCPGALNDQDSPIDFSVKRRSSFSGSLTDDSQGSSCSPPNSGDYRGLSPSHDFTNSISSDPHDGDVTVKHEVDSFYEDQKPDIVGRSKVSSPPMNGFPPLLNGLSGLPGMPSSLLSNGSNVSMDNFSQVISAASKMNDTHRNNRKNSRPFKAYPKEALQLPLGFLGMPGFSALQQGMETGVFAGMSSNEIMTLYNQQLQLFKEKQLSSPNNSGENSPPSQISSTTSSTNSTTNNSHMNGHPHHLINNPSSLNHHSPPHSNSNPIHKHQIHSPGLAPIPSSPPHSNNSHAQSSPPHFPPHLHHHQHNNSNNHHPANLSPDHLKSNGITSSTASSIINHNPFPLPPPLPHIPNHSNGNALVSSTSPPTSSPFSHHTQSNSNNSHNNQRKRPRSLPDDQKDEAYWERRRKNNDAAKRSRDARRAKEDEIALRAALLEQENLKLRVEVAALKTETARLRCMLYNT